MQVGDTIIHGTLKKAENGATAFTTTRIEDPKLVEELDAASVKYSGEIVSRWLPEMHRLGAALRADHRGVVVLLRGGSAAPKAA